MDLFTTLSKLRDLGKALLAKDLQTAATLFLELLPIFIQAWPKAQPEMMAAQEEKTTEELVTELNKCCSMKFGPADAKAPPTEGFISMVWPIFLPLLLEFLKKVGH